MKGQIVIRRRGGAPVTPCPEGVPRDDSGRSELRSATELRCRWHGRQRRLTIVSPHRQAVGFEVSSTKVSLTFWLAPNGSVADDMRMAYIVTRNSRFYVVVYDGIDPLTGRERRRWHPAGASRIDVEAIAATLDAAASPPADAATRSLTVGRFLTEQWMHRRRAQLRATTAHITSG